MPRAKQTEEAEEPQNTSSKPLVVRYIGTSNVRRISKEDWNAVGIDNDTVEWLRDPPYNDQPLERFSGLTEHQIDLYINRDSDFMIVEVE